MGHAEPLTRPVFFTNTKRCHGSSAVEHFKARGFAGAVFAGSANPPRVWSMVTAYFDESGTHHGAGVSAVAGFTATDPEWSSFSIQWRASLNHHGISGPFHMSEFESRKGEFSKLTDE